ncbi:MAG: gamma-glutamyltransferase [Gemmatimonadota bacterium]
MRSVVVTILCLLAGCTSAAVMHVGTDLSTAIPSEWPYDTDAAAVHATSAMVVSDAPIATEVGLDVLRTGGNAIDAVVATAFALAVVYPEAGNIGGGGFMVARMADRTEAALDFREKAPLAATGDMYLDGEGNVTDRSVTGHLASGVPGSVMGLWEAHRRLGTRAWADLLQPAIDLARDGFTVDMHLAASVAGAASGLREFGGSAALFLPGGTPLRAGTRWRNPDLAAVLQRISDEGPPGFYAGRTAALIIAEMERGGGIITLEDLQRYSAEWRTPITFDYRGHRVISMPPSSSGGITLALMANIMDGYPLDRLGWHSQAALHLTGEAMRRAFADRNYFLGDPEFVVMPIDTLVSQEYADRLRAGIDRLQATPSTAVRPGIELRSEPEHTTHISVVDRRGNAVALTTTINDLYGSGVTVAGAGFVLNDEMDDFAAKPGTPNMYGLVQGYANAIEPGKRMLSAMTPTIVLDPEDDVLLVTGARGGPRIISAVFQVISNVVDYELEAAAAVHAPRIHHQHLPDVLYYESDGVTEAMISELREMGHTVMARSSVGSAPTIVRRSGAWSAMSDPRSGGRAAGY